jgi:prophage regulatory protein
MTNERILRLPDVKSRLGLCADSVYKLIRQGLFPAPIRITARASGWLESDVDAFIARQAATRPGRS